MRHSTEPKLRIYVKRYGFLSFARTFGDIYGKKLMDIATETGIDATKPASKRVVQKTAEATGDLTGNKIADKITSVSKLLLLLVIFIQDKYFNIYNIAINIRPVKKFTE